MVKHKVQSPAKINLMLRILNQREDGYHDLQTLFQILDWGDEMQFIQKSEAGCHHISIDGFPGLINQDNLIYKAAQKLKPYAQKKSDWLIQVKKHIPQGAGLGGGSSNAAQVLKFLNHHWQCNLDQDQLCSIGVQLGADVPVFIRAKSALATGLGEQIQEMTFKTPYILLIFPEVSVSTAMMFNHENLTRSQSVLPMKYIHNHHFWINDFFPLLLSTNNELNRLYAKIKKLACFRLSGTGSTLFAVFETQKAAEKIQKMMQNMVESKVVRPKI